ncbi:MAG: hypothetical protein M0Q26_03810 [Chitinophagaceae bacterium]|nr:hypothetical protein [Chitinophagaceae bacterium]MDP1763543.1 hypothetical protein [Sediminibacterium sp.]MDP3667412.1 hypothetical protein [Sediminibacterium sp.]
MTIEFHTPYGKVSETLINHIRHEILQLSHLTKKISKAEVLCKENEAITPGENKVCEIILTVSGDDFLVHTRSENFEKSANEAIKELKKFVKQQVKQRKEIPDVITSTVKV